MLSSLRIRCARQRFDVAWVMCPLLQSSSHRRLLRYQVAPSRRLLLCFNTFSQRDASFLIHADCDMKMIKMMMIMIIMIINKKVAISAALLLEAAHPANRSCHVYKTLISFNINLTTWWMLIAVFWNYYFWRHHDWSVGVAFSILLVIGRMDSDRVDRRVRNLAGQVTELGVKVHILLFNGHVTFHGTICMHCWNINKSHRGRYFFNVYPVCRLVLKFIVGS